MDIRKDLIMDSFKLKLIAITAMAIDHIGAVFISQTDYYWLNFACRAIGRLAFPIFVFLIVEGFYHTSNIKRYLTRLGVFALISELPFDLAFYKHNTVNILTDINKVLEQPSYFKIVLDNLLSAQNVFFTLFLGLLLIALMSMVENKFNKNVMDYTIANSIDAALTLVICGIAYVLRTDYDVAGILMIVSFYLFRESKATRTICILVIMGSMYCDWNYFFQTYDLYNIISVVAALAMIPIAFYNGEKGKNIKYMFYIFYPAHLLLFFIIGTILFGVL